jgi:hypothetical protein
MRNGCRIFTAAVFMVHLMVGCCAHHAHACQGDGHGPHGAGAAPMDACAGTSGCMISHVHHGAHGCQGASCSFIHSPNGFHLGKPSFQFNPIAVVPLTEGESSLFDVSLTPRVFFDPAARFLPPVRLHLLHQMLLI